MYFYWSNHYNHSSYNNLVISGLCGIRPDESDTLTINPLIDNSIQYFYLDDVRYHGRKLTIIYDQEGNKYKFGKGLTVLVDGKEKVVMPDGEKYKVVIGSPVQSKPSKQGFDYALNINRKGYPLPSASVNTVPDSSLYQAIDGRIWYFPEITNRWSTEGSTSSTDWYAVDFGKAREVSKVKIYLFADDKVFGVPENYTLEYKNGNDWHALQVGSATRLVANTESTITFNKVSTTAIRINFKHQTKQVALVELECY